MKSVLPFYCANQQKYIPPCKSFSKSNIYIFYCKSPRDQSFGGKGLKKTPAFNSPKANNRAVTILNSYRFIQIFSGFIFTFF